MILQEKPVGVRSVCITVLVGIFQDLVQSRSMKVIKETTTVVLRKLQRGGRHHEIREGSARWTL
jgi:hypothetical protein